MRILDDETRAKNSMLRSLVITMFGQGADDLGIKLYEFLIPC
jgi:hypothetical protein